MQGLPPSWLPKADVSLALEILKKVGFIFMLVFLISRNRYTCWKLVSTSESIFIWQNDKGMKKKFWCRCFCRLVSVKLGRLCHRISELSYFFTVAECILWKRSSTQGMLQTNLDGENFSIFVRKKYSWKKKCSLFHRKNGGSRILCWEGRKMKVRRKNNKKKVVGSKVWKNSIFFS